MVTWLPRIGKRKRIRATAGPLSTSSTLFRSDIGSSSLSTPSRAGWSTSGSGRFKRPLLWRGQLLIQRIVIEPEPVGGKPIRETGLIWRRPRNEHEPIDERHLPEDRGAAHHVSPADRSGKILRGAEPGCAPL